METLARLREPAAFVVFGALCAQLVVSVISLVVYGSSDAYGSVSAAAVVLAGWLPPTLPIVILTLLVASCLLGRRTRHAGVLAVLALIAGALSVLLAVVFGVIGFATDSPTRYVDLAAVVISLIVPTVAVVGLGMLLRAQGAAHAVVAPQTPPLLPPVQIAPPAQEPDTEHQPTWQPDAATGVAWHTAGEAATGAPGSGWSNPNEAGGWQAPLGSGDPWRPSGGFPPPEAGPEQTRQ
jgi:hypothetical protein